MQNGIFFITICAKDRHPLFGKIQDGKMALSEHGEHARHCIDSIESVYPSVSLESYVVMPTHVHILLAFLDHKTNPSLDRVVKQYKSAVSKMIGFSPWQDSSFINTIITARKLKTVRQYIIENPLRWKEDKFASMECE